MSPLMKLTNDAFTLVYVIHAGTMRALLTDGGIVESGDNFISVVNSRGVKHTIQYESLTKVSCASLFFMLNWVPHNSTG